MKTIEYKCKFCKKPGTVEYDDTIRSDVSKWIPYLACSPCASYHQKRITIERKIEEVCLTVNELQSSWNEQKKKDGLERCRQKLSAYTRDYANLVCKFLHKTVLWEPDFVEQLVDNPRSVRKICYQYRKMIFYSIPH